MKILSFICLVWMPFFSEGQTVLSDLPLLYKMSQAIQGTAPSEQDKQELKNAQAQGNVPEFFTLKSKQYLSTENHSIKMSYRLSEMFKVQFPTEVVKDTDPEQLKYKQPLQQSSLDDLFSRIAKDNLSWDTLATGKDYTLFPINEIALFQSTYTDYGFYQTIAGLGTGAPIGSRGDISRGSESALKIQSIHFSASEPQIAGAITTPRFFERYANSQSNHNRRRAAAIYNLFVCDNMSPVVPSSQNNDPEIVKLLYPDHKGLSEGQITAGADQENLHGKLNSCIGCHQKLDPVGHVFDSSPLMVSKSASRGALVMIRNGGEKTTIPVRGFAELGIALIQQPEYEHCQVQRFWRWFIGQDIPLDSHREAELVGVFAKLQHKTNDFIQYLLLQPEFRYRLHPTEQSVLASDVRKIFRRCSECHQSSPDYEGPDLSVWPLASPQSRKTSQQWLETISDEIDLAGQGAKAEMPPKEAQWNLSQEEFAKIQKWISLGAPDEFGKMQGKP